MAKTTNKRDVILRVDRDSNENEWLDDQESVTRSLKVLIDIAYNQYGHGDLIQNIVSKAVSDKSIRFPSSLKSYDQ